MVEDIQRVNSRFPLLFVAKDKINPMVKVFTDIIAFQGFTVTLNEDFGVA
jgi:hypothetical protein